MPASRRSDSRSAGLVTSTATQASVPAARRQPRQKLVVTATKADGTKIETAANAVTQTSYYFVSRQWPAATIIGHVIEPDGRPVRRAVVTARGQSAFTDNNGGFVLANVPVITSDGLNDQVLVEISYVRPDGSIARTQRTIAGVNANQIRQLTEDFALPRATANQQPRIFAPLSLVVTTLIRKFRFSPVVRSLVWSSQLFWLNL